MKPLTQPIMGGLMGKKIDKWEIESGLRTLVQAEEIKKNSKLMRSIKKQATKEKAALSKVTSRGSRKR